MTPDELAKTEQGLSLIADVFPSFWGRMFCNLLEQRNGQGKKTFTRDEALGLLHVYIRANAGSSEAPKQEEESDDE